MRLLQLGLRGRELQMWVSDSVFSVRRLDPGTAELLRALPEPPSQGSFLDLGCGWGPIAVTLGLESPEARVWAVDVNPRALALTDHNAEVNGATNVEALEEKVALTRASEERVLFDLIVSNPPVRIGKQPLRDLVSQWLRFLSPAGEAWFVMARNLGADSFIRWLNDSGYPARKHSSRKGYRIIQVSGKGT